MSEKMAVAASDVEPFDIVDSLTTINSILAGQEIKLSFDQAVVQEVNTQIDRLKAQTEELKKQTSVALQNGEEREKELKHIALLKESMFRSMELTRKSSILLEEQKWHYQEQIQQWRQKQNDVLTEHYHKFNTFKHTITADLPLYEKLEKLKSQKEKLLVDWKYKERSIDLIKYIRRKNCEIKRQLYNADIVNFVKACKAYKTNQDMFIEIKNLEISQSKLESRYKELQQTNVEKEVKESTNCLSELEEWDKFEKSSPAGGSLRKPTAPPLSINEKYSFFTETSVFETTKLVTRNYKMRTVLLKRKHSNSDEFGLKPEKSKVKILNVQTITPEKRLKKLSQSKFIAPTPIKNVEEIRSQGKENDANLQTNGGEEDGKDAAGNLEVFSKDECMPVATSQSVNAEFDAKIDTGVTHQEFDIENETTDEPDIFNISNDGVDNEEFLSMSHDPVGGFMSANTTNEVPFFTVNPSHQFFNVFPE